MGKCRLQRAFGPLVQHHPSERDPCHRPFAVTLRDLGVQMHSVLRVVAAKPGRVGRRLEPHLPPPWLQVAPRSPAVLEIADRVASASNDLGLAQACLGAARVELRKTGGEARKCSIDLVPLPDLHELHCQHQQEADRRHGTRKLESSLHPTANVLLRGEERALYNPVPSRHGRMPVSAAGDQVSRMGGVQFRGHATLESPGGAWAGTHAAQRPAKRQK